MPLVTQEITDSWETTHTCEYEGICWESVKTKYQKITDIFIERYPNSSEADIAQFLRASSTNLLTKERTSAKIKRIRSNYKKAVDARRRSGGGRIVLTFYDLCENVWGGSPAVQSIDGEIDFSDNALEISGEDREQSVSPVPSQKSENSCNSSSGQFSESYQSGNEC